MSYYYNNYYYTKNKKDYLLVGDSSIYFLITEKGVYLPSKNIYYTSIEEAYEQENMEYLLNKYHKPLNKE